MACVGLIPAISNEGELNLLDRIGNKDSERTADQRGIGKAKERCRLSFRSRFMARNYMQRPTALTAEGWSEQMIVEERLPHQFASGSDAKRSGHCV